MKINRQEITSLELNDSSKRFVFFFQNVCIFKTYILKNDLFLHRYFMCCDEHNEC